VDNNDYVPRSIRRADFMVVFAGFLNNIAQSVAALTDELMEISVYNANRETKITKAQQAFSQELENLQEE
jgi:hypothetical protein